MKLEQRVETLEHELHILKNEIQATLLEIQEQILNHYYPELRAEEPAAPPAAATSARRPAAKPQAKPRDERSSREVGHRPARPAIPSPSTPPFSDVDLSDFTDLEDVDGDEWETNADYFPPPTSRATRFSLDEAVDDEEDSDYDDWADEADEPSGYSRGKGLKRPPLRETPGPEPRRAKPANGRKGSEYSGKPEENGAAGPNRRIFAALAEWVSDSVSAIGKARTQEVIDTYAAGGGRLTGEAETALQRLLALAEEPAQPAEPAGNKAAMQALIRLDTILHED